MSDIGRNHSAPTRIGLVGATGLIGLRLIEMTSQGNEARIVGIARREVDLPPGARVEMFVADPARWGEVFEAVRPRALICALGTTWKKAGGDEATFRAVDHDLVISTAQAAHAAGIPNMVLISSAGANPQAKQFYLKVKGETEKELSSIGLNRLDILRPGLLKGSRKDDLRPAEWLAQMASPITDPLLPAKWEMFRSIDADIVCQAALGLAMRKAAGRFIHDNEAMKRASREWRLKTEAQQE